MELMSLGGLNKLTIRKKSGVGAFQDYYETTILKDYSASTVSWIPSLQIFFMMALVSQLMPCIPWCLLPL
jgi:hypothetical protein